MEFCEMKMKKYVIFFLLLIFVLLFIHSEYQVPSVCHEDHDSHDFGAILSNTLVKESFGQIKLFYGYECFTDRLDYTGQNQIIEQFDNFLDSPSDQIFFNSPSLSTLQVFLI